MLNCLGKCHLKHILMKLRCMELPRLAKNIISSAYASVSVPQQITIRILDMIAD